VGFFSGGFYGENLEVAGWRCQVDVRGEVDVRVQWVSNCR